MDPYQHRDCLNNIHWIPPWYDLPEGADPDTHNPWLIADSATKQTPMDLFRKELGMEEINRRIEEFRERMRERPGHLGA